MIRAPKGYLSFREALDRIGTELFGNQWTGQLEHRSRSDLRTREELHHMRTSPGITSGGTWAKPPEWDGPWVGFTLRKPDSDEGTDQYESERIARVRLNRTVDVFLERLEAGAMKAAELDSSSGKISFINLEIWRTHKRTVFVSSGIGPSGGTLLIQEPTRLPVAGTEVDAVHSSKGRRQFQRPRVMNEMRAMDKEVLRKMDQVAMAATFHASRETCVKARNQVLKENVAK